MPRASWRGFLRLSLVSCPIYLSPATTRTKSLRLHQVWQQPASVDVDEDDFPDLGGGRQSSAPSVTRLRTDNFGAAGDESPAATRITLRPHDPGTGEEIEKREVVKGYEYSRGQFLTFTAEELKALDVESSKVVDLEKFVAGDEVLSRCVLEFAGAVSGGMRIRGQAAKSIGCSARFWFRVCHPSILRIAI